MSPLPPDGTPGLPPDGTPGLPPAFEPAHAAHAAPARSATRTDEPRTGQPARRATRPVGAGSWKPRLSGAARWMPAAATVVCTGAVIAIVIWQMGGGDLFTNTTTTGGDTGAHYMLPPFIRSALLPHFHLTGWDPGWYDGFPLYTFYFVLPDLLAALGSFVIHYNVAFKLVTVAGSLLLPVGAWACGRLFRLRPPGPAALAAATLPFLFDYTFTIYGGNLFSTLAGEYAYTFSIALALLFLGLFALAVRTGRYRGWAAIVLALCVLSHIIPALYALGGAAVLTVMELGPRRMLALGDRREASRPRVLWWAVSSVVLGLLLSGWWLVPFGLQTAYSTSMGYLNVVGYPQLFFPEADLWVMALGAASAVTALALRSRFGICLGALAGLSALALIVDPQGAIYNVRFLPLWFLSVYLLVGWGFATAARGVAVEWRRWRSSRWSRTVRRRSARGQDWWSLPARPRLPSWQPGAVGGALVALLAACTVVLPPFVVPASWLPVTVGANQVSNWAAWNYTGYEGKPAYPEYRGLMAAMSRVGRVHGCGRAMWEYNANQDRFGTPEALMLLPYWTGGCIDSMEGLLFESSTTTPYHFLNQAELSEQPSNPMVGLPYGPVDVPLGVRHLQMLGVRYFMAASPQIERAALADPSLRLIATSGPWSSGYGAGTVHTTWDIFLVRHASLVTPLTHVPAVLERVRPAQSSWLDPSVAWYLDPSRWSVELAQDGPSSWPRVSMADDRHPPSRPVPPTTVTGIRASDSTISFHVSRVGTPVLVKTSYFPNWQATGASGPWRVTPNLMVVVPHAHDVTLTYGASGPDRLGEVATGLGLVGLLALVAVWVRRRRGRPGARARPGPA